MCFHIYMNNKIQRSVYTVPGAQLRISSTHSPGDTFPVGETAVYYTATDQSGNNRTCELIITVQGNYNYRLTYTFYFNQSFSMYRLYGYWKYPLCCNAQFTLSTELTLTLYYTWVFNQNKYPAENSAELQSLLTGSFYTWWPVNIHST